MDYRYDFFGPVRNDFPTIRFINYLSQQIAGTNAIELPADFPVRVQKLYQQFNVMMSVSVVGGLVLAFPYIVWELWRFIAPGLHPSERKNSTFLINGVWILFLTGVMCGYFLILPFAINFGVVFKISDIIEPLYDLSDYAALFSDRSGNGYCFSVSNYCVFFDAYRNSHSSIP